jgi:hypothetical protein
MKHTGCRVCGGHYVPSGTLERDALAAILSARWRDSLGGIRDWICFSCLAWAARVGGVLA